MFSRSVALFFFLWLFYSQSLVEGTIVDSRLQKLTLSGSALRNIRHLHYNWYLFSLKALLAQLGKSLMNKLERSEYLVSPMSQLEPKLQFIRCLSKIQEVREIENTARCLVDANSKNNWRSAGDKKEKKSLSTCFTEISKENKGVDELESGTDLQTMSKVPPLQSSRQPVKSLTKLFTSLFTNTSSIDLPHLWEKSFKKMKRLQKKMDKQENSKSSHVYKYRMFDIIMGRTGSGNKSGSDPWENIFTLANAFGEKDTNIQILSPRIMPVLPSSQAKRGILSPAIFPLYHDESEQQILPIPKMLDKWGLSESDRNSILQMIMEISGARQTVEDAIEVVEHLGTVGIGDAIYRSAAKLKESFEKLKHSFDKKQKNSLKKRGFAIMDPEQTKRLHDDIGINKMAGHENFADSSSLTRSQRYQSLWKFVETIASKPCRRRKRQLGGGKPVFSVFAASILSPYMFAPVYGFSVLGPVVLSPNIFSPLILNPSVLGPWVLSPSVPLPFIVSPYLLSPYVLSPLVLAPFILSPYVISPNVINPYVLAPVILSPVVLSPDVISPMVLGGPILSPGVLSPSVLSKSAIMANILSPTVLSR